MHASFSSFSLLVALRFLTFGSANQMTAIVAIRRW